MRIRSIKPEFWRSKSISALELEDRLLFVGLWSYVDDNGVGIDRLSIIAADLFADDVEVDPRETFARVSRGLANLSEAGRIIRYTAGGRDLMAIANWEEHQRIDKPGRARYPSPTTDNAVVRETVATPSRDLRETPAPGAGEQGSSGSVDQRSSQQPTVVGPRKRGHRLPASFIPSEAARTAILTECPQVDIRREHAKFVDHWNSTPGQRGVKLDWDATWRNWMRRAGESQPANGKSRRQQETDDLFARASVRLGVTNNGMTIEGESA